jgi:hypothetical protein
MTGQPLKNGDSVIIPYFENVGEMEDLLEGEALTPRLLTMSDETSKVVHSGIAGEITAWAQMAADPGADPYAEYAKQFVEAGLRRIDRGLVAKAKTTSLVHDVSALFGTLANISWDNVIDAKLKWGDEVEDNDPVLMIAHSAIKADIEKLKSTDGTPLTSDSARESGKPLRFNGVPVMASDTLTPTAGVYDVLIVKRGALAAWIAGDASPRADQDILADTEVLATHLYHVEHLYKRPNSGIGTKPGVVNLKVKKAGT